MNPADKKKKKKNRNYSINIIDKIQYNYNNLNNGGNNAGINSLSEITTNPNFTPDKPFFSSPTDKIYIGKYIGGQKNGQGKLLLPNDSEYEGNFKNNEFDGYGVFKSKVYNYWGNYTEGKKNGKGKFKDLIKESIYEGEFIDDKKNGYGEEKYSDGTIYRGYFKNGLKDGKGTLILKNGNNENNFVYEGEFKEDNICGIGRIKYNKKEYFGEWKNNEMSGYGVLIEDQIKYYGYFEHSKKVGYGALFYLGQSYVLIGKWEEDLCEGPSIYLPLNKNNNKDPITDNEYLIVGMYRGEIINMNLGIEDINTFKNSEEYQEMINLYQNKFYPDYLKDAINKNDINSNKE